MKRVLIIYHRVDYDGLFSAIIARKHYLDEGCLVELLGYNYGDKLARSMSELLSTYDEICMVDISFNDVDTMKILSGSRKVILIDHHDTCINMLRDNGIQFKGIQENGNGACLLTYKYFYPDCDVPEIIGVLSMYDVWDHSKKDWNKEILPVQYALRTTYGMSLEKLISDESYIFSGEALGNFQDDGLFILDYLRKTWKGWVKNYSFDVNVAGQFKGIGMLTPQFGSLPFETALDIDTDYQVYVCANKKRKTDTTGKFEGYTYSLSLYSSEDKIGDFSLGEYVKSITQTGTGGGHKYACGMELTEQQFIELITLGKI